MKHAHIISGEYANNFNPIDYIANDDGSINWGVAMRADPGVKKCPGCGGFFWNEASVMECPDCATTFGDGYKQETSMIDSTSDARTTNNTMRHQYKVLSDAEKAAMLKIKDDGLALHTYIASLGKSRELSLAQTKVEEAVMWAVKHVTG